MKEKLTNNIGLKILSIVLAAILWLVITNIDDPEATRKFTDVKVEVKNENVIASLNQVYDIIEGETIDFTFQARRSIRDKLSKSDFVVTADFSKLSIANSVPIEISCPKYENEVEIVEGKYQTMKVSLEQLAVENYKADIILKGEPAEGYIVGVTTASPNIIRVSGPRSRVERIAKVIVEADVSGETDSFTTSAKPKVLDEYGKEIDATNLSFSKELVEVNIDIYKTKKINLQITTVGEPAYGYAKTNLEYEPKTITVAGEDDALKRIMYLSIEENITGATKNIEKEINLQEELEEGLILVGEDQTAVIYITIEKLITRDVSIWPGDIEPRNKPENLSLTYNTSGPLIITIMGFEEDINGLNRLNIKPYVDLTGFSAGTYTLPFVLDQPEQIILMNNPSVSFILSEESASG